VSYLPITSHSLLAILMRRRAFWKLPMILAPAAQPFRKLRREPKWFRGCPSSHSLHMLASLQELFEPGSLFWASSATYSRTAVEQPVDRAEELSALLACSGRQQHHSRYSDTTKRHCISVETMEARPADPVLVPMAIADQSIGMTIGRLVIYSVPAHAIRL
jgi:hypothetical protein